ncbi:hypothetical protein OROGR_020636 [Orobanche gracilis]
MLEKDSLSRERKVASTSASDCDPMKETSCLASDSSLPSGHDLKSTDADPKGSEIFGSDAIFSDKTNIIDDNSFNYQLGEIIHTSSDLDFFENAENKGSNDFLYYGWPEIGSFEEIDGMFRTYNPTLDIVFSKDDELGWSSSANDLGRCEDVLKLDVKFPCSEPDLMKNVSENHELSNGCSLNDSAMMTSTSARYEESSWASENSGSCMPFSNGPATSDRKDGFIPQEQFGCSFAGNGWEDSTINKHKRQINLQNQSKEKINEHYSGNGSFNHIRDLSNDVIQHPFGLTSHHVFLTMPHKQNSRCADSYDYLQNPTSYLYSDNCHTQLSDPATVYLEPSSVKSETTNSTSVSLIESSDKYTQYMESSHEPPVSMPILPMSRQREKLHSCEGKYENQKDPEGVSLATPAKLGSPDVQESSIVSLGLDVVSPEAASFRQLQLVMEQLDLRMKLCIRDSLYRLAHSAGQRHNHANLNVGCRNGRDIDGGASMVEGTNRYLGASFMDLETDTNHIDRSVAHLLFYRPSHSPHAPAHVPVHFKSPSVVHGSVASPTVLVDISEETVFEAGEGYPERSIPC